MESACPGVGDRGQSAQGFLAAFPKRAPAAPGARRDHDADAGGAGCCHHCETAGSTAIDDDRSHLRPAPHGDGWHRIGRLVDLDGRFVAPERAALALSARTHDTPSAAIDVIQKLHHLVSCHSIADSRCVDVGERDDLTSEEAHAAEVVAQAFGCGYPHGLGCRAVSRALTAVRRPPLPAGGHKRCCQTTGQT